MIEMNIQSNPLSVGELGTSTTHFLDKFDFDISNQIIGLDVTHY